MKFLYQFKTSENERREGMIAASSREDVYRQLKSQGIKPFNVELAPGLWNRVQSLGKRGLAIVILLVALVFVSVIYLSQSSELSILNNLGSQTRRQIIGDLAVVEKGVRTGWDFVFSDKADQYLASFAIPATGSALVGASISDEEILKSLDRKVAIEDKDSIEVRQIKEMVEGMKTELRSYLADGGNVKTYRSRLVERQQTELAIYRRVKDEIDKVRSTLKDSEFETFLEKRNEELRKAGIRPVLLEQ